MLYKIREKEGREGENQLEGMERKGYWGVKKMKVLYIYAYEDSIMKAIKHWKGKWGGRKEEMEI
jgi:hypothetical protein